MKILHIITGDLKGGAARGAYWLHKGLLKIGVESKVLISHPTTIKDDNVYVNKRSLKFKFYEKADKLIFYLLTGRKVFFSSGFFGLDITKHPLFGWADVIHFHWINLGFISIKNLSKVDKPIIYTMRDMWAFTGGCHVAMVDGKLCKKYKQGCSNCELVKSSFFDIAKTISNFKEVSFPDSVRFVGISEWISNEAKRSKILKNKEILIIPNNIDEETFYPVEDRVALKSKLNLPRDKKIILIEGRINKDTPWKGFDKLLNALKQLEDKENLFLLVFGSCKKEVLDDFGFEYRYFGFVNNDEILNTLYNVSDVYATATMLDAFGKTLAESLACGTPVVCFDTSGPSSIVEHKVCGYKAIAGDEKDLSNGILWVLNSSNYENLRANSISRSKKFFSLTIAKEYKKLYKECL